MSEASPGLAAAAFALAFPGLSVEEALALREGRDWRHLPGDDPGRLAGLLAVADLEAHLRGDGARRPRVGMADETRAGSAALPDHAYCLPDGRVDLPRLLHCFDAGASLIVSQFDETHPPLQRLCRGLEKLFLHAVQANIYLTPPGARGFRTHYDTHDVLVLQVEGRKRWRIWPGEPFPRPTRRTPWPGDLRPEGAPATLTLAPGDALYIPRGVFHDAAAEAGGHALHVTLGFLEPCWAEALRRLLEALEREEPVLREAVPTWRIGEGGGALEAGLARVLARLSGAGSAARLEALLLRGLVEDRQPLPARGLLGAPPAGRLRLAEGMHHLLEPRPDGTALLHWAGGVERLSAAQAEELAAYVEGAVPRDAAFAARLWRCGLLEPAG